MALHVPFQGGSIPSPLLAPDGAAATPAVAFNSDADGSGTGLFRQAANSIGFAVNGSEQMRLNSAGQLHTNTIRAAGNGVDFSASFGGSADVGLLRHAANVLRLTPSNTTNVRGLFGGGAAVASATALPLPTGRLFHVTGTTTITSITSTNFATGVVITLIFDGVLTFTDGNNLKLAGNFVTAADSTITLVYDGTNWYEICRSTN